MNIDNCFQLGYIAKTHGVQGEVTFVLDVDNPEEYDKLESVFVEINGKLVPFFITHFQLQKEKAIVKLEDVNSFESADKLVGNALYLPLTQLPELDEDQFYYHDIINYIVIDKAKGTLGTIANVYELPHQDLIAMTYLNKEVLIPVTDEIVTRVDHKMKELYVELPDGLLDIYLTDTGEKPDDEEGEEADA
jgi:16S rRNA processing protein RimM